MSERPRVLMVGPAPPAAGGIASVIEGICASALGERFAIERFATSARHDRARGLAGRALSSLRARGLGFDGAFDLEARAQIRDFTRALASRPALAHLHCSHGWDFWLVARMARLARDAGVPALLHSHGNFDVVTPQWSALRRAAFPHALRAPDRLLVLSESWKTWFAAHLDPARIDVVPNGVDTARFAPREGSGNARGLRLLFVGTRDPDVKGARDLLAAAPEILGAFPDATLLMAGEDPEHLEERLVRGTALAPRIAFVGKQEAAAMPSLYASADLLLLPSRRDASPLALVEAMASGLPVVASRVGAVAEILPAEGGVAIEPGDVAALARGAIALLSDASARARAGRANRERVVREFDRARMAERLGAIYERAIARR